MKYSIVGILGIGDEYPESFTLELPNMKADSLDTGILTVDNGGPNAK